MKINSNEINGYNESSVKTTGFSASMQAGGSQGTPKSGSFQNAICYKKEDANLSLMKQGESKEKNILEQAEAFDEKNSKNYMVVMSNTLSDEEYKALQEGGDAPNDYDPAEAVTLVDQIKVTLAQAGVVIAGYTDDLSESAVAEVCGNQANASAILDAMKETGLNANEDVIKDISREMEKAALLTDLSDAAKQYILQNELDPTIDNLYKATYAGAKNGSQGGYYTSANGGYYEKAGSMDDLSGMEDQLQKVIEKAGLEVSNESMAEAKWLLENGLALTEKNLYALESLNQLKLPMTKEAAALCAADAISVGLAATKANPFVGDGYQRAGKGFVQKAMEIDQRVKEIEENDVEKLVLSGKTINIRALLDQSKNTVSSSNIDTTVEVTSALATKIDEAKKQLIDIQLQMSAQANLKLLKQGIQIELEPLEKLSTMLAKEESIYHATELSDVLEKAEEIKNMPAATLGVSVKEAWAMQRSFTLDHVYEVGKGIAADFAKASASYETLMTAPRADLGDRIQDAFRNVDDLLTELDLDASAENQRAVRILGYNQMAITVENIEKVKGADAMLSRVLLELTPAKALEMIREGVNPMTMNLDELANYLSDKKSAGEDLEKYSKFLYKLEQNNEISAEEREAYIGIYRLLRQVEKSDRAALGRVIDNKQMLNLENLLGGVRTRQKGYVDTKIDDGFGMLSDIHKRGASISDQILGYYNQKAAGILDELGATVVTNDATANMDGYAEEMMADLRDMNAVSEEMMDSLLNDGIPLTVNHVLAENALVTEGSLATKMAQLSKKSEKGFAVLEKLGKISEAFAEGKDAVTASIEDATKEMEEIVEELGERSENHIDVRSYAFDMRQISLMQQHAQNENYYVPLEINQQWTMLHVTFKSGETVGNVTIDYKGDGENLGKASISFDVKKDYLEGFIVVDRANDMDKYQQIGRKCSDLILKETGRDVDISCVQGQRLRSVSDTKEQQGQASNKELYQIAKLFMETISNTL